MTLSAFLKLYVQYELVGTRSSHRCLSDDASTWNIAILSAIMLGIFQDFNFKCGNCAIGNQNLTSLSTMVNIYNILRRHKRVV